MPSDSVLAKAAYKIPTVVDADRICVSIPCPNDPDHIANLLEAIASLGLWSNYRLEADRRAKPVADVWEDIYRVVEESLCNCGLRNGPNGIEQLDSNTGLWIPIQGNSEQGDPRTDGTVPPPWPDPPPGETGNCLAAANIVGVFQSMQLDAGTKLTELSGFATLLVGFEAFLGLALPLIGEVIVIATEMGAAALDAGAILWASAFDPATQSAAYHGLQCVLHCWIAADGSVTQSNITNIKTDFLSKLPTYVTNPSEAALWAIFVPDFLDSQGKNGLMKMAKLSNITDANCDDCDDCGCSIFWDFSIDEQGFEGYNPGGGNPLRAQYSGGWGPGTQYTGLTQMTSPMFSSCLITTITIVLSEPITGPTHTLQITQDNPGGTQIVLDSGISGLTTIVETLSPPVSSGRLFINLEDDLGLPGSGWTGKILQINVT